MPWKEGEYVRPLLDLTVNEAQILANELFEKAGIRAPAPGEGPILHQGPRPDWARKGGSPETDTEYIAKLRAQVRLSRKKQMHTSSSLRIKIRTARWRAWRKGKLLAAVKAHCQWCNCGEKTQVENCKRRYCALWPWRVAATTYRGGVVAGVEFEKQRAAWNAAKTSGHMQRDLGLYYAEVEDLDHDALLTMARAKEYFCGPGSRGADNRPRLRGGTEQARPRELAAGFDEAADGLLDLDEQAAREAEEAAAAEDWDGLRATERAWIARQEARKAARAAGGDPGGGDNPVALAAPAFGGAADGSARELAAEDFEPEGEPCGCCE
jgi:hypothetical protein